jgi:acyl dehydratase
MTPLRSFDELEVSQRWAFGTLSLSADEIVENARKCDPQPFHTDPEAAKASPLFGGLVASGLHTMGACFGLIMGSGLFREISLGGSRIDTRWPAPLHPDEEIAVEGVVEELRASKSRPGIGVAQTRFTGTRVGDGAVVIEMGCTHFLKR